MDLPFQSRTSCRPQPKTDPYQLRVPDGETSVKSGLKSGRREASRIRLEGLESSFEGFPDDIPVAVPVNTGPLLWSSGPFPRLSPSSDHPVPPHVMPPTGS